ncbi:predicted protein [Phaeodactylum tricornutum CCAP 1055/1]|uniref:Uncharacterized protein n=3 Tax=Phaeodactylum tricornutum TaxID=2850 RepID=B7FZX5_PHATC|nr:predicted protein [Phaeodactylum tricornutum CCAP 1055/1]EEC47788.1 predicted protein [Phaeodactylum tricornutum CCAP 1055/1]|eukprot:XP_002180380.1 predicted protein [Phaeodactylum tricornutum CCAP 1055/1]
MKSVAMFFTMFLLASLIPTDALSSLNTVSRRAVLAQSAGFATVSVWGPASWAVDASLIDDLTSSIDKLRPIPDLLEEKEWDKVRSILKLPPVNKLWNLGDCRKRCNPDERFSSLSVIQKSQNIVLKLAQDTGNIDLFELKEELAYTLQMCDQITYNNAFVYFQPGSGKFKIKEPQELARQAMKQIQDVIDAAIE